MAVTAVIGSPAGALNYTFTTDTSADWASVANSTYFYDKADKLVHFKNASGTVLEIFAAGGSAAGVFGISNTSGVYTYYTTLTLAMAAATSGQVIEMFGDVVETTAVTIDLKDGVSINGNGHSYTFNYSASTAYAFTILTTATFTISNMKIARISGDYYALRHSTSGTLYLNNTTITTNQATAAIITDTATGTMDGGIIQNTSATGSAVFINYNCIINNMKAYAFGSGHGFTTDNYPPTLYNCYGQSNSGAGIRLITGTAMNCVGVSVSGAGFVNSVGYSTNCLGKSISGIGFQGAGGGCIGTSVSGWGYHVNNSSSTDNCIGISSSSVGFNSYYGNATHNNFTAISTTNAAAFFDYIYSGVGDRLERCYFWSKWDNAAGHAVYLGPAYFTNVISSTTLRCTNATAKNIFSTFTISFKIFYNIFINGSGLSAGITNSMTNVEDAYGNIKE